MLPPQRLRLALDEFSTQTNTEKCAVLNSLVVAAPLGEKELRLLKDAITKGNAHVFLTPAQSALGTTAERLGHWPETKFADECLFCPRKAAQLVLNAER